MNERQKLALLAGFGVFFGMLAYCPWKVDVWRDNLPPGAPLLEHRTHYDWSWDFLHRKRPGVY